MNVQREAIPAHFFEDGQYEVWASKYAPATGPVVLIADKLTLATARAYKWTQKEIRLNGEKVE